MLALTSWGQNEASGSHKHRGRAYVLCISRILEQYPWYNPYIELGLKICALF